MTPLEMYRLGVKASKETLSRKRGDGVHLDFAKKQGVAIDRIFKARAFAGLCSIDDATKLTALRLTASHISALTILGERRSIMRFAKKASQGDWSVRQLRAEIRNEKGVRS